MKKTIQERIDNGLSLRGMYSSLLSDEKTDSILQAMYDYTQEELKRNGIDSVLLQRGIFLNQDELSIISNKYGTLDTIDISGNVLESWTTNDSTARGFGNLIIETEVPASRIIGTARTGFGCLDEYEFVVLGGENDLAMIHTIR